ncbi:MAG: hypothetical protein Q9187_004562 [Circinaria calcarea]
MGHQSRSNTTAGKGSAAVTNSNPFLTLPRELRDRVYEEVLGGNLICVKTLRDKGIELYDWDNLNIDYRPTASHHVCRGPPPQQIAGFDYHHESCEITATMNIDLFFANHQVSREASDIFWGSNTFLFECLRDFVRFCDDTNFGQQAKIRSLQFRMTPSVSMAWEHALHVNRVRRFSHLQKLTVHIRNILIRDQWVSLFTNGVYDDLRVKGLFQLRGLPLLRLVDVQLSQHPATMPDNMCLDARLNWNQLSAANPNHGLSAEEIEELEYFLEICILKKDADPITIWDDPRTVRARAWDRGTPTDHETDE